MRNEHQTRETLTRADAAARLRALADQIETGRVAAAGVEAALPDQLRYKFEIDHDDLEVKIKWRA
jgi:amphi-Trp domain-containing protein